MKTISEKPQTIEAQSNPRFSVEKLLGRLEDAGVVLLGLLVAIGWILVLGAFLRG